VFSINSNFRGGAASDSTLTGVILKDDTKNQEFTSFKPSIDWKRNDLSMNNTSQQFPGNTLISDDPNRRVLEVDAEGDIVWALVLDYPEDRIDQNTELIFDVERLKNDNILIACSHYPSGEILEFNRNGTVVWSYSNSNVSTMAPHDADRLDSGNTLVTDTYHSKVFELNPEGSIVWVWDANDHRDFFGVSKPTGSNWAHLNDADRLANGNTLISLRNLDMIVEVDHSGTIVWSYGQTGNYSLLHHQHDPDRLPSGTTLIADSENDRIIEVNTTTNEIVWMYEETLNWPRDADRLPNGNTLITDSRNKRILEVTPEGELIWEWRSSSTIPRGIYDADRIDIEPPKVLIESPSNKSYSNNTIAIIISSSERDLDSVWFSVHDDTKEIWITPNNVSWIEDAFIFLVDGQYTLFVFANDTRYGDRHSNIKQLAVTFIVDTLPPWVQIESPQSQTYGTNTVDVAIVVTDLNPDSSWYRLFCTSRDLWIDETNVTYTQVGSRVLFDGEYTIFAWTQDISGNLDETDVTFSIETGPPIVLIESPSEEIYSESVLIHFSCVCNDWDHFWYRLATLDSNYVETWYDPSNISYSGPEQRRVPPGSYVLYVWANDSKGNIHPLPTKTNFTVISLAELSDSFIKSKRSMTLFFVIGSGGLGLFTYLRKTPNWRRYLEKGS